LESTVVLPGTQWRRAPGWLATQISAQGLERINIQVSVRSNWPLSISLRLLLFCFIAAGLRAQVNIYISQTSPNTSTLMANQTATFQVLVTGASDASVTWSIDSPG